MLHARYVFILAVFAGCVSVSWSAPPPEWNGGGSDNNWSNPLNWTNQVAPANDGSANIGFAGDTRLTSAVDAPWSIASLAFSSQAGAFTITQFPLSIGAGGIVNNSANTQTLNTDITLTAGQTWNAAAGPTYVTRAIDNNRRTLTVDGAFDTTIYSTITNRGGLIKNGGGNLRLGSGSFDFFANTYTGATTVNAGTLTLRKAAGVLAVPGDLIVNGGSVIADAGGQISTSSNVTLVEGNITFGDNNTIGSFTNYQAGTYTSTGNSLTLTSTAPYALTVFNYPIGSGEYGSFKLTGASGGGVSAPIGFLAPNLAGLDLGAVDRVINAQGELYITGPLTGGGGIIKTGSGNLWLRPRAPGAGNTYAGGTTINGGGIGIDNDASLGNAAAPLNINGGTVYMVDGNVATAQRPVSIGAAGAILQISGVARVMTLTAGASGHGVLSGSGPINKRGSGALVLGDPNDAINHVNNTYSGTITVNDGTLMLRNDPFLALSGGGIKVYGSASLDLDRGSAANSDVFFDSDGSLTLFPSLSVHSFTLLKDAPLSGTTLLLNAFTIGAGVNPSAVVYFKDGPGGITLLDNGPDPSTMNLSIDLGNVQRDFNVADNLAANDLTITSVISNGGVRKIGPGTLALSGINDYSGGTLINGGTVLIGADSGLGAAGSPLTLDAGILRASSSFALSHPVTSNDGGINVDAGETLSVVPVVEGRALTKLGSGTLVLANNTFNDSLTIDEGTVAMAGRKALHFNSLHIAGQIESWVGILDLQSSSMVLERGDLREITDQIASGLRRGTGITSTARGAPYRLGSMSNNNNGATDRIYKTFEGIEGLNGNEVLVRYTVIGDLNLDGAVTISDFIDLAAHFNTVGEATWQIGDVNYDGSVTIADFIDLSSNFGQSVSGIATPISQQDRETLASFAAANSAVPEPAVLGCMSATLLLLGRRYNRSCI